ncbi:alpha-tectorin-like [Denticeps clupeoides]|uniref:alpha-tectorin-like n=1 Tax=Denticeps clupeoides TaxID=299321 RepID=UPI0010A5743C|nr:alpha-tectorin-like [Denticeps clupeoides]XP_028824940.1 alpha-tectorin-like [Denticeps clupeoides]
MRGPLLSLAALLVCGYSSAGPPVAPTAPGSCWAMGDPHYRTFDGYFYNFMGDCTYTMAMNCDVDYHHPPFEVNVKNKALPNSKLTAVSEVTVNVYGINIQFTRSEFGMVKLNNKVWNLPITINNGLGQIQLMQSGLSVILSTDFGLTVQYDWVEYVLVTVPSNFMGRVCGMCGNFNGNQQDDLSMRNGSLARNVDALGKSWRVPNVAGEANCKDECTGECQECSFGKRLEADMFCGVLTPILDLQFRDCHNVIDPSVFFQMCKYDHCRGGGLENYLCRMLEVYTDACQRAGVKVHDWRSIARCSNPKCPENSHFEQCGNACPSTCDGSPTCKSPCVQTCTCNEGYMRSGNKCVPKAQLCLNNQIY